MDLRALLIAIAALAGLAVFAGWRGMRLPNPHKGPRMIPWRFIMMLATAGVVLMAVHAANLMGVTTGR